MVQAAGPSLSETFECNVFERGRLLIIPPGGPGAPMAAGCPGYTAGAFVRLYMSAMQPSQSLIPVCGILFHFSYLGGSLPDKVVALVLVLPRAALQVALTSAPSLCDCAKPTWSDTGNVI